MLDQAVTISALSAETGIDRRTISRALLDVEPAETITAADGRVFSKYDRSEALKALAIDGQATKKIARAAPFGGSVPRAIAWNVLQRYVRGLQFVLELEAKRWHNEFGIDPGVAALTASAARPS